MKGKKGLMPEEIAWVMALLVLVLGVYIYETRSVDIKDQISEINDRDATQIATERFLTVLLQQPVQVNGHEISMAELFAYRELADRYEPQFQTTLSRYSISNEFQLTLQSGDQVITDYGPQLQGKKAFIAKTQIPSLSKKTLTVTLKTVKS